MRSAPRVAADSAELGRFSFSLFPRKVFLLASFTFMGKPLRRSLPLTHLHLHKHKIHSAQRRIRSFLRRRLLKHISLITLPAPVRAGPGNLSVSRLLFLPDPSTAFSGALSPYISFEVLISLEFFHLTQRERSSPIRFRHIASCSLSPPVWRTFLSKGSATP